MIPEQWQMPLAVLSLLLVLLFVASLLSKYQAYKAHLRAAVKRVESAIPLLENALDTLSTVPLSQPLRVMLRGDIYTRLKMIRDMSRSYPRIAERLNEAKLKLDGENVTVANSVPPIETETRLNELNHSLEELVGFLDRGGPITHHRTELRLAFREELKERKAEVLARYHMIQSNRLHDEGDGKKACNHLTALMKVLQSHGPNTDFVRELHNQAEKMLEEQKKAGTSEKDDDVRDGASASAEAS